jgi:HEAT repeat protein
MLKIFTERAGIAVLCVAAAAISSGCGLWGPSRTEALHTAVRSGSGQHLRTALRKARQEPTPGMEADLLQVLRADVDPVSRALAAEALGELGSTQAVQGLRRAARNDASWLVRSRALQGLVNALGRKAAGDLQHALQNDPASTVRAEAVKMAARALPGQNGRALLLEALKDQASDVRLQAQVELKRRTGLDAPPRYEAWKAELQKAEGKSTE